MSLVKKNSSDSERTEKDNSFRDVLKTYFPENWVAVEVAAKDKNCGCSCHYTPGVYHVAACCHPTEEKLV